MNNELESYQMIVCIVFQFVGVATTLLAPTLKHSCKIVSAIN